MISSPVDEIKKRLDIVEIIGTYIKLKKAGANFRALCPFHSEKNPSFFVSPARQIWHCFGCGKGGDIFGFVKEIEGVEFGDALRILAQKAGVELRKQDPKLRTARRRLYEICELATKFFQKQLESKKGKEVEKYLLERGISRDSIRKWQLGWAPDDWKSLSNFLVSKGYKREEVEKAGLAIKNEKGSWYDRFRGRIIFPVFDLHSQVVGFGGRVFDSQKVAKYINTPNTLLYDKGKILYGLDKAKVEIRKQDFCLLAEGYTDVILGFQAGFKNIVASSGTALTPWQLKILKRYSENLFTAFDMDVAGSTATKRGISLAQSQGFNIKTVILPKDKDPADIISKSPKEFKKLIEKAKGILDFYFENALSEYNPKTPEEKKAISKILLPVIKRIPNKIEQSFWIQKLAKTLEVKEVTVNEELKKVKLEEEALGLEPEEMEKLPQKSRKELLEERLATLLLKCEFLKDAISKEDCNCLSSENSQIISCLKEDKKIPSNLSKTFNYLALKAEVESDEEENEEDIGEEFKHCLREIKRLSIKEKLDEISKSIRKAEESENSKKSKELTKEFNRLAKQIS